MADYVATLLTSLMAVQISPPGRTTGFAYPPPSTKNVSLTLRATNPYGFGTRTAVGDAGGDPVVENLAGAATRMVSPGVNWFDKQHVLPRTVDFDNIITSVTRRFEVFNASSSPAVVSSVLNNPLLGLTLSDTVFPLTLQPYQSTLEAATTIPLVPSGARVIASPLGLATFDDEIVFSAASGSLRLGVAGTRTVALLYPWESGTQETLEWKTVINKARSGTEQRIAVRSFPRQSFQVEWLLDENDRRRQNILIEQVHQLPLGLAIWTEQCRLTAAVSATSLTVTVDSTTDLDLRVGELGLVYNSAQKFDVLRITGKTATTVTFESGLLNGYSVGDYVMPLRIGRLPRSVDGSRYPVTVQGMRVNFVVEDNHTGIPEASTTGWSSLDGKVLLDDFNFIQRTASESRTRDLIVLDNEIGLVSQTARETEDKRAHAKTWITKTKAELYKLRKLLMHFRGRQVSFKIPTFAEDIVVTQTLTSGSNLMTIENIWFSRYVVSGRTFRITFTDGTSVVRTVTASTELSASEERLTLDASWSATKTAAEVRRVEFIEDVRLDSDSIVIQHGEYQGKASVATQVRQVQ
jgi:hypothetical protein